MSKECPNKFTPRLEHWSKTVHCSEKLNTKFRHSITRKRLKKYGLSGKVAKKDSSLKKEHGSTD